MFILTLQGCMWTSTSQMGLDFYKNVRAESHLFFCDICCFGIKEQVQLC